MKPATISRTATTEKALRRALEHYYLSAGKNDPVRISIPKVGYVPVFRSVRAALPEARMPAEEPSIAVMPLNYLNADPEQAYFSDALSLVYFHRGEKDFFLRQVDKTIALKPNAPDIAGVAGWHMMLYGEWERGLALLKKGMKLNPYHPSWFHLAPYMDCYRRGDFENALAEALKYNFPDLYWDPLVRAAAISRLGRTTEARKAVDQLLRLEPDFAVCGRDLIGRYVKVDDVVDKIVEGLQKAGLADLR